MHPVGAEAARNTKSAITKKIKSISPMSSPKPARLPHEENRRGEFHLVINHKDRVLLVFLC
jgi:hypothetical protein